MKFFKLQKNSKIPAVKWQDKTNYLNDTTNINIDNNNIGFITGTINNIFVLDIDVKDDGLIEWNKYLNSNIEPLTVTTKTPSGGYHYYFNLKSKNDSNNFLINNYLTTKSKYRGVGLDIRSNGGYVVYPPSKINNFEYKFIRSFDKFDVLDMPSELIYWLLDNNKPFKTKNLFQTITNKVTPIVKPSNNCLIYEITDNEILILLNKLDKTYFDNYLKWLMITTILKSLNKHSIWDIWSKKSLTKYNKINNSNIWNCNDGHININYLIHLINDNEPTTKNELIEFYKPYEPLTQQLKEYINIEANTNYISNCFTYEQLYNNDIILIQSCTGTGKTTAITKNLKSYLDNDENMQIISIVSKISLNDQHKKSFDDAGINLISYDNEDKLLNEHHIGICINSLLIYQNYSPSFFNNKIIFIDEINSLIECVTHNETIDKNLKLIYQILIKIIKNCRKLIVCDALISDNVLSFLNIKDCFKRIFIKNSYKNYQDVEAINIKNENDFLIKLLENCKFNKYFLFGCDSCKKVTEFYTKCVNEALPKDKTKYILITADSKFKLNNASEQFKNKFVFYSPSITFGIDFSIKTKQDVFIYCKGNSILPSGVFQQTTRTRAIDKLYYYCNTNSKQPKYNSLDDVYKHYENIENLNLNLHNICLSIDETDTEIVNKNTFFKLFCYNEYIKDIYKTNTKLHFEIILKNNGFNLSSIGEALKLNKTTNNNLKAAVTENIDNLFNSFIEASSKDRTKIKYSKYNDQIKLLNLDDNDDILKKFKNEIVNDSCLQDHFNLIKLLKSNEFNDIKLTELKLNSYNVKCYQNIYNKINLIRTLEKTFKLGFVDVAFDVNNHNKMIFEPKMYELIQTTFSTKKHIPTSWKELKLLYIMMIKSITGVKFIKSSRIHSKKADNYNEYIYTIDMNVMRYHSQLLKYRVHNIDDYHEEGLKLLNMKHTNYFN